MVLGVVLEQVEAVAKPLKKKAAKTTTRTTKTTRPSQNTFKIIIWWFFVKFDDSRHAQLSIYTVFHEESEFEVEHSQT